ncbi:MAG: aminopeptidase P family protein [Bacteroidales bacterium]|nr:aminopeptidase P family protein [Bacteroidales bacterium]
MFSKEKYLNRRKYLIEQLPSGIVLLPGNERVPMNYAGNAYPFRQDSHFLYYFGIDMPGLTGVIDVDSGESYLFGDEVTLDELIWVGEYPSLAEMSEKSGVSKFFPKMRLENYLATALQLKRTIHYLPPYRADRLLQLSQWLSFTPAEVKEHASDELISVIVNQRSVKDADELNEIELTINQVTSEMFLTALRMSEPGIKESEIVAAIEHIAKAHGCRQSFIPICSVNGHYLHNESYANILREGQLLLVDAGSESKMHYATDLTRVFPVAKTFTTQQAEIYQLVLDMQMAALQMMKPGITYFSVHMHACKVLVEGLKSLGLMNGDTDELVEQGAHALFFPHGLGHLMGLDVHDMEDLGEQNTGYDDEVSRSTVFGTRYLRYGKKLKEGLVLTVEPGIYFIPLLIQQWKKEEKFKQYIHYEQIERYLNFGGIRIEDDVVITNSGCRILGNPVPKTIAEIELLKMP